MNMKTAAIAVTGTIIALFILTETWLLQHKSDPAIHVAAQTLPQTPTKDLPPETTPGPKDVPQIGDKVEIIGKLSNGSTAGIDVTSGDYDHETKQSSFLVIEELAVPMTDKDTGDTVTEIVQRVVIDCAHHKIKTINATGINGDDVVMHFDMPNPVWKDIPQKYKRDQVPFTTTMEKIACPAPDLLGTEQSTSVRFTSKTNGAII